MSDESTAPSTEPVMLLVGNGGVAIEASTIVDAIFGQTEKVNN